MKNLFSKALFVALPVVLLTGCASNISNGCNISKNTVGTRTEIGFNCGNKTEVKPNAEATRGITKSIQDYLNDPETAPVITTGRRPGQPQPTQKAQPQKPKSQSAPAKKEAKPTEIQPIETKVPKKPIRKIEI